MQPQIRVGLPHEIPAFSLFLDNEEFPCEILKIVALYPAYFVVGDLALHIAGNKKDQVSLAVKMGVLSVKVMSD